MSFIAEVRVWTQDYEKAVQWWQKAAQQDNARAQSRLGEMYSEGKGVTQDDKEALKWWQKAADQGDGLALLNLATMYIKGEVVEEDQEKAMELIRRAAKQGYAPAQDALKELEELLKKQVIPSPSFPCCEKMWRWGMVVA